ncbi:MAG: TolC family protein [Candidatus Sumerlaeaceae bacterium]|nr:TolC family protein [Candidatus Sumerlaeaceae bacterium]
MLLRHPFKLLPVLLTLACATAWAQPPVRSQITASDVVVKFVGGETTVPVIQLPEKTPAAREPEKTPESLQVPSSSEPSPSVARVRAETETTIPSLLAPVETIEPANVGVPAPEPVEPKREEISTGPQMFTLPTTPLPPEEMKLVNEATEGAEKVSLIASVCRALSANQSLQVDKLSPEVSNTSIESAYSEFDTTLNASVSAGENYSSTLGALPKDRGSSFTQEAAGKRASRSEDFSMSLSGRLPTGTDYSIGVTGGRNRTQNTEPFYNAEVSARITQNLLKGGGTTVNMIGVWTAQNNFVISLYQLQNTLINLVTDVQATYWDLYLAQKTLEIQLNSFNIALEQSQRTEELVRVGKATPLDFLSAQAEQSARVSEYINAAASLRVQQLRFLRLLNPNNQKHQWRTAILPNQVPSLKKETINVDEHVKLAKFYRPDLRQAQIDCANGELEVTRTENGLLPSLDFFTEAGLSGVGNDFGDATRNVTNANYPRWRAGLEFSYALQNRAARAAYRRSSFQLVQAQESIKNYEQIIEVDVRLAAVEIARTERLVSSTKVTVQLRGDELKSENEKFRVGRSTQLLVNQAQRDFTNAQLNEVSAEVANIKAYLALYKAEGTTLQRLGIKPITITPASGVPKN